MPPMYPDGIRPIFTRPLARPTLPPVTLHGAAAPRLGVTPRADIPTVAQTPQETRADTESRATQLADAIARVNELQQQRNTAPRGLRHEYDDMLAQARGDVTLRRDALSEAMAVEFRLNAQQTAPDPQRNIYDETGTQLQELPIADAAQSDYMQALTEARHTALQGEPANLYEAQWQRNAEIWEAEQAQWDFENQFGSEPVVQTPSGLTDPALEAQRAVVEQEWQDVRDAFGTEYRIVQEQLPAQLPSGSDPLTMYRTELANAPFDPRYRERILASAQTAGDTAAIETAIDARVDSEVQRIEDTMASDGAAAAFDQMVAAKDGLSSNPISVPGMMPDDPVVLALAQQAMDERLRPIQQQIAASAPADLQALADAPAATTQEQVQRALAVSERLALYAQALPADLVPQVVQQSHDAWAPSVALLGELAQAADSSHPPVAVRGAPPQPNPYTADFNTVAANFSAVGEVLAGSPDGDPALEQMASEFAGAIDEDDIGAFDEAFGKNGVGEGHGAHLAVQIVNQLAGDETTRGVADDLLRGLRDGNERWAERAASTLEEFAHNRDLLNHYIETFPGGIQALTACDLRNPTDPTALELRNAINEYLANNPEVRDLDAQLLQQIDDDGVHLLHLELALQGLSPEAASLEHADEVASPVQEFLAPDDEGGPALWQIYASTPGVRTEMGQLLSMAAAYRETAIGSSGLEQEAGIAQQISESQGFMSMARNARFTIIEMVHPTHGVSGLRTSLLADSKGVQGSGVAFFGAAATSSFLDAAGVGNPDLGGLDRFFAGARGTNYTFIAARDTVKLGQMWTRSGTLESLFQATGPDRKAYVGNHTTLARGLQLASRSLFVVTDTYALVDDSMDGRNGGVITGDAISLAGSALMLAEAGLLAGIAPAWASASWAGPVGWVGAGLWTAGAVVKYQFTRVEQSNRYETADQRRFLAHFGSLNDDGSPRVTDPNAEVEVSNATDHDPDIDTVPLGDAAPEDIVYTGLSADAVDELMNYSGSPDNPVSGVRALDALAASRGIDPRRFYLEWFDGASHEERKALTVAAQGVNPGSAGQGITDEALTTAWRTEWQELTSYSATVDPERISEQDRIALWDYVTEHEVVRYGGDYGSELEVDPARLRVLLGLEPAAPGEQAPTPEVIAAAEKVIGDTAIYGRDTVNDGGFRPTTIDELAYWTQLHDYPALPGQDAACAIGPRPTPDAPPVVPEPTAEPIDHEYVVQRGDTLWDIADRTGEPTDVWQLMAYHNTHNPGGQADFDPQRADRNFFTPHAPSDQRRDPDLIHPGEIIHVADVADIRRA